MPMHGPDQGFSNTAEESGNPSPVEENEKFCKENLIYMVMRTWEGVILTIWTFFKAKNNIL